MKHLLPHTISDEQSAFVAGGQILDASLIANELIEEWDRQQKKGAVIKLDIEKAFDKVDWDFLDDLLKAKGFVVDVFSRLMSLSARNNHIRGFDLGENSLNIQHLQFVDDTILFSTYDDFSLKNLLSVIRSFEEASRLNVNKQKSEILGINLTDIKHFTIAAMYSVKKDPGLHPTSVFPFMASLELSLSGTL
ncbi:uncharacterized protein LOC111015185 [Momordica charantia]|uniref:Uncharacterized protein LOC111015185 n=1 Tax=Momordica charantia TaxID=3673 RepID=A0A6J1CVL8_MOMCH|nr:uncharacterized protein LOC111015185 [Momordica charantia]